MFHATRREVSAEFLGTFVLMIFGLGVNAQVTLGQGDFGGWLALNIGWGVAVTLGVYVAGGVTGAHINPAVTLGLAVTGRHAPGKVMPYMLAQLAGAFVASGLIYFVYFDAINAHELAHSGVTSPAAIPRTMETAGIWGTYPRDFSAAYPGKLEEGVVLSTFPAGLIDQIVGTALLLLCICALTDNRNLAPQSNVGPIAVGMIVLMIGMAFGYNCGYAINPARDFSPRLFTFLAGWGSQVFTAGNYFWWVPIAGPCIGAIVGCLTYDFFITRLHPSEPRS